MDPRGAGGAPAAAWWQGVLQELESAAEAAGALLDGDEAAPQPGSWHAPQDVPGPPDAAQVEQAGRVLLALRQRAADVARARAELAAALDELAQRRVVGNAYRTDGGIPAAPVAVTALDRW